MFHHFSKVCLSDIGPEVSELLADLSQPSLRYLAVSIQSFLPNSRRSFQQIASNEICRVSNNSYDLGKVAAEAAILWPGS